MKVTKSYIKQLVKEELNRVLEEEMAPYGIDPYKLPQRGTVGEYKWKVAIVSGSNTASELSATFEITDKAGKTIEFERSRIWRHELATMLGKLSKEPAEAKELIDDMVSQGKEKAAPVKYSDEQWSMRSNSGGSEPMDRYWNR